MAFMSQQRKATIAQALKLAIPRSWKYSLAVRHHSTIVLTINAAPVDLLGGLRWHEDRPRSYAQLNGYHWRDCAPGWSAESVATFEAIFAALNAGNHDRSDLQSDYFDVGWYVDVNLGRFDRPFLNLATLAGPEKAAA